MSDLAFVSNYQRIRNQFYGTKQKPRVKIFPQIVYDNPVGPTVPAFWISDQMMKAHSLIEGRASEECLVHKDPFAMKRALRQVVADIAMLYGISLTDIYGKRRSKIISAARHHVMFEISQRTEWSLPQIGRFLDRDHTTVLHGIRCHKRRIEKGEVLL